MSLFRLPWVGRRRADGERVLVFASRFDSRNPLSGLALLGYGLRIWRGAVRSPGCVGASLWAKPLRGKYYTLSAWESEEALGAFARSKAHRSGVKSLRAAGKVDGALISWWEGAATWRPNWKDAMRRADASPTGPYAGPAAVADQSAA
ncbi:MAG: antibiotic biosynthesis monooxygenase family protein [Actinomycetes bacterium]